MKLGATDFGLGKIGQHVGDWEHFTLRIRNFSGELRSVYFSQHSCGRWVDMHNLEFVEGNKAVIYSSRGGHADFLHLGTYLQGWNKLCIGIRNDAARSELILDSSVRYEIVAAEYLGGEGIDRITNALPRMLGGRARVAFGKLPSELYGEQGPTVRRRITGKAKIGENGLPMGWALVHLMIGPKEKARDQ